MEVISINEETEKTDVLAQRSIHAVIKENSFFLKLLHYHQWVFSVGKVTEEDMTERGKKKLFTYNALKSSEEEQRYPALHRKETHL